MELLTTQADGLIVSHHSLMKRIAATLQARKASAGGSKRGRLVNILREQEPHIEALIPRLVYLITSTGQATFRE